MTVIEHERIDAGSRTREPLLHRSPPEGKVTFCGLLVPEWAPRFKPGNAPPSVECVVCADLVVLWKAGRLS